MHLPLATEMNALQSLGARGWLASCPPDFATALLNAGYLRAYDQGMPVIHAGDCDGGIWGIASGQLLSSTGIAGPNTSLTAAFLPGEWGGTGPLSGYPRHLDCVARVQSVLHWVPQAALRQLLAGNPGYWQHISRLHFIMAAKFGLLAADLQIVDSRARVAGVLLSATGQRLGGDTPSSLAISQEEVGRMANLSRFPVGKILRSFASCGLITSHYGRITLAQPALLRRIAERED